ncbi:Trafficking protein particle complex subunit 9 [Dermatophagoides farinae]|uniref:Trafficking protein particle complex subunit 9 n=1 Tax=Dermatophagoides farinae TaxID=6954 RepID=A0A922KYY3_DERFA|nr:Trafficking protein particle complex subunit 9 [Dermatophagoides farinae]
MSVPDYDQFSEDHQSLLIVVKPIDNDWGDFQAHRKLIGLITVARSFNRNEIESISELHKTIHDTYNNTLFDSKCFIIQSFDSTESSSTAVEHESEYQTSNKIDGSSNDSINDNDTRVSGETIINNNNSEIDPLLDFDIGGQLYITSDHTCFTSRIIEESMNYSLPPLTDDVILTANRPRTHSRNKSLDSKLLSITTNNNNDSQNNVSQIPSNNLSSAATITHKRAHSSTTSLSTTTNNCDSPIFSHSSANEFIQYESNEQCCEQIKSKAKDFLNGLFWTLESKRLDKTREKKDKIPLLMAPCEKKDLVGLDTDTRSFRRKCLGRMQKHIADLSLMTGLPQESFLNYLTAIEYLKGVNDKLWLASAYEGLCSASLVLLFPKRWHHIHELRYRFFYTKGLVNDLLSRKDYEIARMELGQSMKQIAMEDSQFDQQIITNKTLMKSILTIDQFYEKYKEAASNYALYRGAAVLEFECSFKATKTLTFFRRYLKASDFIQNAVFISLNQPIEDQIERLLRISQLYEAIGFFRKAAFFKRFAALKSVSQAKNLDWEKCYFLLLPALYGYGLTLNPNEYDERLKLGNVNCSAIHVQLLQEIITTSLKMQKETLAIRHLSFMLQCLFTHITPSQRQEFATKLSSLASKCGEGSPVPLRLSNGATIPSVNFTKFPTVVYFKIEPLKPYLKLYKLRHKSLNNNDEENEYKYSGPFIYTPLQLNRSLEKNDYKNPDSVTKMNFYWAEGHTGCVSLSLHNYLPIELNISSIIMMTDGVAFEPKHDTSLKILPNSTCTNISLTGIPRSSGVLDILGYKIHTLGIKSDCRLKQLPNSKKLKLPSKFTVEIVPRLPLMCAQCMADDLNEEICLAKNIVTHKDRFTDCYIGNQNFISLFEGQCKSYRIKLTNISANNDELIDLINMKVIYPKHNKKTATTMANAQKSLIDIEWDIDSINNLLPFGPGLSVEFDINFTAKGDFILFKSNEENHHQNDKNKLFTNNESSNGGVGVGGGGGPSIQPKKLQVLGSKKLANFINELQSRKSSNDLSLSMNTNVNNPSMTSVAKPDDEMDFVEEISRPKLIELCLQLEYSGGPGLNSGFCRRVHIYFVIEIKSSILITHWDVIQAEQMDECYLVFDTLNATDQEINLIYSSNKEMLIEPKEKCRIPVSIKRCPLSLDDMNNDYDDDENVGDIIDMNQQNYCETIRKSSNNCKYTKSADFLTHIFPTDQKLEAILSQCRLHLLRQINLKWTMPNADIDGMVCVEKVPYSKQLLKSLLIPPIQSEIELNSMIFRSSFGEMNLKMGEHLSIVIRLFNNSDTNLQFLRLYLVYYQDYQNSTLTKTRNYNINDKMIVIGCESLCINELQTKKSYIHPCGLIFLYAGVYKLEICCLPEERYQQLLMEKGGTTNTTSRFDININNDMMMIMMI